MEEALKVEREATLSSQERDTNQGTITYELLCEFNLALLAKRVVV